MSMGGRWTKAHIGMAFCFSREQGYVITKSSPVSGTEKALNVYWKYRRERKRKRRKKKWARRVTLDSPAFRSGGSYLLFRHDLY